MHVFCNGERKELPVEMLAEAVAALGFAGRRVAIAVNETFVPKSDWGHRRLQPGDRLDVLAPIEGG